MADAVEKQRQMTRQRLEAKRRKREEQQYEEDMAASIVTMAEKQFALIREKTMLRREGQKDTVSMAIGTGKFFDELVAFSTFYLAEQRIKFTLAAQFFKKLRKWLIQKPFPNDRFFILPRIKQFILWYYLYQELNII